MLTEEHLFIELEEMGNQELLLTAPEIKKRTNAN
jgi:hypothetical protein